MAAARNGASLRSKKDQTASDLVLQTLKDSLADVTVGRTNNQYLAKHTALNMVVSMKAIENRMGTSTARVLGVDRHNLKPAAHWREGILALSGTKRVWASRNRRVRSDRVSTELREYIQMYWHNNTRPSPMAKNIIKHTMKHFLHTSQVSVLEPSYLVTRLQ